MAGGHGGDEGIRVSAELMEQLTMVAQGGPGWLAGAMAALGIAIITTTMLRGLVKRRKGTPTRTRSALKAAPAQTPAGAAAKTSGGHAPEQMLHAAQRASLEHLMVEVQELTRVCAAQIENRASRLELLIAQADERLARLAAAQGSADALMPDGPDAAPQVMAPVTRPVTAARSKPSAPAASDAREAIRALHAQGKSATEIATATGEPIGKVELVIALHAAERAIAASAVRG
ncbi:MAG: hypothetical protein KDA20_11310 [Phycisphaerales bacterium]|nr:hypothetical protein [Phycisphaerales bacterium]